MQLKYRPEIDGLRALAVLAVVLFHSELIISGGNLFSGGFLGVDIFFVISGYLITQIIVQKLNSNNFRFIEFFDRRIRRLAPALITVSIATTIAAYFLLGSSALKEFSGSVLTSLGISSNFYFWGLDDYLAEPSKLRPFLHTWSLGIEEQFYIFFPVLLVLVHAFWRRQIRYVILLLTFASLIYAIFLVRSDPKSAFFLIPTRAWEFGVGSFAGLLGTYSGSRKISKMLGILISFLALILLLFSIAIFDENTRHPSEWTIFPVVGTALFLYFSSAANPVSKLIGLPAMRWLGKLSYSLYLWHWPVIVFAKYQNLIVLPSVFWALLSFIPAVISYYLIERPLRHSRRTYSYGYIVAGLIALVGFHTVSWKSDGLPQREDDTTQRLSVLIEQGLTERRDVIRWNVCHLTAKTFVIDPSCNQIINDKPNFMFVGDSLGADLYAAFGRTYSQYHFLQYTGAGCTNFPAKAKHCVVVWDELIRDLKTYKSDVDLVIFHGRQMQKVDWSELANQLGNTKMLVILPRPEITPNPRGTLEDLPLEFVPKLDNALVQRNYSLNFNEERNNKVSLDAKNVNFGVLDISKFVFPKAEIEMFSANGQLNLYDYAHWTVPFGEAVGNRIAEEYPELPF